MKISLLFLKSIIFYGIFLSFSMALKISHRNRLQMKSSQLVSEINSYPSDGMVYKSLYENDKNLQSKTITVEIISKKRLSFQKTENKVLAYDNVYKEMKDDKFSEVMDSPIGKILEIAFNPITLCLAIYFSSYGWSKLIWLQKILKIFGKGTLVKKKPTSNSSSGSIPSSSSSTSTGSATSDIETTEQDIENLPLTIYECENCGMEMRPARGRAEIIFSRPRFRCSRCGAKASSYFNIDDMNDPRAVARKERLEREQLQEEEDNDGDDDN